VKGRMGGWEMKSLRMRTLTSVSVVISSAANLWRESIFLAIRATSYPGLAKKRLVCRGGFNVYERS